jgi:putative polyhydroxyalkanoate system protein
MAEIRMEREHSIGLKKAKAAAQKVADELADVFDMESEWEGNVLHFTRAGVSGQLAVTKDSVSLHAKLGLLLSALKPKIEHQIQKNFDKYFG